MDRVPLPGENIVFYLKYNRSLRRDLRGGDPVWFRWLVGHSSDCWGGVGVRGENSGGRPDLRSTAQLSLGSVPYISGLTPIMFRSLFFSSTF